MSLSQRLVDDLKDAMRAGDSERRDVVRYLRAAIKNREIELRRPLTDDEIVAVIRGQIKQRRDSIELYRSGGREDLADAEAREITVLETYLPAQMPDTEIRAIARRVIDETSARGPRDMGKVMPRLIELIGGRADGSLVSQIARQELTSVGEGSP
jgi:hypothetical protein